MRLPLFVTKGNKYVAGSIMFGLGYLFYYLTNHYPYFEPKLLPLTFIDTHSPFLPYSVFVYISEYFFFSFVYILLRNHDNINKYLYSFFFLQVFSCTIFVLFPTTYPRENFPVPTDLPNYVLATWAWLRHVDTPGNCFPSLHVSSVYLSSFAFWSGGQRKAFWVFFVWATLIALSTLTTKQHYVADIGSGIGLSLLFYRWFHLKQAYVRVHGPGTIVSTSNEVA